MLLVSSSAAPEDLAMFCAGYCRARYQEGYYAGSGRCGCVDFYPINLPQRFEAPTLHKGRWDIDKKED